MYCPHCGREMVLTDDVFTCVAGDMPLSRAMHATLTECFSTHRPRPAGVEVRSPTGAAVLSECGVLLGPEMVISAPAGKTRDLLFPLVERRPTQ